MLHAKANSEDDPEKLANFARRSMKKKKNDLILALNGYVYPHQRMILKTILTHIDFLTEQIKKLDQDVAQKVSVYQESIEQRIQYLVLPLEWQYQF
ncbi:hypothetical protein ACFWMS_27425 [Peribacillus butanolivorans]|uniref:hypothetical protein n=1 Tax=Peribacillus butanolivorans TaxID=421767 RepID=UPI0036645D2E